ncbi:actVA 6 [Streptomyces sp. MMG1533]|uniref:antibiotic biosynthesis monooxygenase n=1 Tax=Streptomyces sp. MMG1533 TaxID=1415546 RepID=UPI0006AF61D7|nr:antibiotic biosynthesis monooxygenase [Streptomyces sp. MMG1533]KOU63460.1 actVA 6 [Streptomyces sp. MMG1533]
MTEVNDPQVGFVALVTFPVDGPATQRKLVELATGGVQEWIREVPGFLSATYHASTDGSAVVNYAQWESEQAYRENFAADPRSAKLREALSALPGLTGPPKAVFMTPEGSVLPA